MRADRKKRYNPDWVVIAYNIRTHRAKNRCEKCGLGHGSLIHASRNQPFVLATPFELQQLEELKSEGMLKHWQRLKALKLKQVILTVAHVDHDESNNSDTNLLCLCQWCHLSLDRQDNAARRRYGYLGNVNKLSL